MGKIILKREIKTVKIGGKEKKVMFLDNKEFNSFNPEILGLGDISLPSTRAEAIAAVFDLSGFTKFCGQVDPHLTVPEYLSRFLDWLFEDIRKGFVKKTHKEGKELWADLPFLAKFLGDGVLFLWDTEEMGPVQISNVVVTLWEMCEHYVEEFYPRIKKVVAEPPSILRCGMARGSVFSVGNGDDYVAPCINIASRLQKLSLLSFCVSRRGFEFADKAPIMKYLVVKSVSLRGIGERELVWVRQKEFDGLPEKEKKLFGSP